MKKSNFFAISCMVVVISLSSPTNLNGSLDMIEQGKFMLRLMDIVEKSLKDEECISLMNQEIRETRRELQLNKGYAGKILLHTAINKGFYETVRMLIESGAYVDAGTEDGKSTLDLAAQKCIKHNNVEALKILNYLTAHNEKEEEIKQNARKKRMQRSCCCRLLEYCPW